MVCPIHNVEAKTIPAGVSKRTGKQYPAFQVCAVDGCSWKPTVEQAKGWPAVREQVAQKVAPEKASMTRADWEAKEARTNKNILLQVAFKAAVEIFCSGKLEQQGITETTLFYHNWLLSQTEGQPAAKMPTPSYENEPPLEAYENDVNIFS